MPLPPCPGVVGAPLPSALGYREPQPPPPGVGRGGVLCTYSWQGLGLESNRTASLLSLSSLMASNLKASWELPKDQVAIKLSVKSINKYVYLWRTPFPSSTGWIRYIQLLKSLRSSLFMRPFLLLHIVYEDETFLFLILSFVTRRTSEPLRM